MKRKQHNIHAKRIVAIALLIIILAFTIRIELHLNVISVNHSKNAAKYLCSDAVNTAVSEIMTKYTYDDLVSIVRSTDEKIASININSINVNHLKAEMVSRVQAIMNEIKSINVNVSIGTLLDIQVLSGLGPQIPLSTEISSAAFADFKSEFYDSGINQTVHRIMMTIDVEIYYITWSYKTAQTVTNEVVLAETVIVGEVPDSYRNFEIDG